MKELRILLVSLIIFFSCEKDIKTTNNTISIDLISAISNKERINLSSIAKSIDYIPLQTDSLNLIGKIDKPNIDVLFIDNKILINSGELFLFTDKGRLLNKIGTQGRGPDEYVKIADFATIKKENNTLVAIHSGAQQKAILYNLEGNHVKSIPIDFWPMRITSLSDDIVCINLRGVRKDSDYYAFSIISPINGKLKKRLLYKGNEKEIESGNKKLDVEGRINYYKIKDTLSYWESGYDTIWRITDDLKIFPKYVLNIGENKMPINEQINGNLFNFNKIVKYNSVQKCFESQKYLFFETCINKRLHKLYYDKNSQEVNCVEFKKPFGKGIHFSFYNNIDGGMPFWPQGKMSDNKMFMLAYGYEIKDYLERIDGSYNAIDEARERLLKLVKHSKISDNPILMVVTLNK
ncbi:6-bladed beta-propeller [Flavivirga rizhaonensis]|uniref:6-bladed beta-propeller n=1 Tax=Flavivirga rizhaonensis TaxID=2559571 RepID=A0A4S1DZ55_9FLAO|nr:6-bladed beta-propeller [Flavivirga rizhaonensis]TGV03429.1 6-bladed beta-propeller [Flavivirga rizhaonensis]